MTQPELATNVADGVLVRVRAGLPEFTGALRRVAEQVLGDPAAAARATIVELAERSGTSPATVTRFCRALGFEGYAELRLGIAGETGRAARQAGWAVDIGREIQPEDSLERVLHQIMAADSPALGDTSALLDLKAGAPAAIPSCWSSSCCTSRSRSVPTPGRTRRYRPPRARSPGTGPHSARGSNDRHHDLAAVRRAHR